MKFVAPLRPQQDKRRLGVCALARFIGLISLIGLTLTQLSACAPLLFGGALAGGAVVATDRRSVGIQLEDEAIERRIGRAIDERYGKAPVHINPTSYNRKVLLVGEAPNAQIAQDIEALAAQTDNVRAVVNEIVQSAPSTTGNRLNDVTLAGKVRAALIDERDVPAAAVKPTVERGVAYLLGRVTEAEGNAAARAVSRVDGLVRVVKVFDLITEDELRALQAQSNAPASPRKP